jgi:predicted enzyme related to lactoylglutathione lyase
MSEQEQVSHKAGEIVGLDLTVSNADEVRDFYASVIGWTHEGFDMDGYSDYFMQVPATGKTVSGICHLRGENSDLPPVWIVYIKVDDLEVATQRVVEGGGKLLTPLKGDPASSRYCVIQDPAGAMCALMDGAGV